MLLLVALCLPFLGRAHAIDDPLYLQAARHVLATPGDPWGGASFWHERPTTLFHDLYNPPLVAYLLALPVALDGGSERAVHLLMLGLAGLALLACARAGEALGVHRRWTLLLAASPALASAALSALTDVPFLLFSALAWNAALRGRNAAAGLATGLSAVTKYVGLLNLPLVTIAAARRGRVRLVGPLVALALFAVYAVWSLATSGALHVPVAARFQRLALEHQGRLALSFAASLGLAGLPAALALLRWTKPQLAVSTVVGVGAAGVLHAETGSAPSALLAFAAAGSGAALLWAAVAASLARRAGTFPSLAFWSFTTSAVLLVYFAAARYALPVLPPLLWLLVRGERILPEPSPLRFRLAVGAASLLTLLVLWGDAGQANAWREAARRLPLTARGFVVGHWGFQHYAEQRGYRALAPREELQPHDRVAEARGVHGQPISRAHAALLAEADSLRVASPELRLMDRAVGAGFYSDAWGLLPFALRARPFEEVQIRSVVPWIPLLLAQPLEGWALVDLGSAETSAVCLDGWSEDESFLEGATRRSFVWAEGAESALRLLLPAGIRRVRIVASPDPAAVGPLTLELGSGVTAVVVLQPGWRHYEVPLSGTPAGGVSTVVLRPAGHRRPGVFDRERRRLSFAVDRIAFGDAQSGPSRGVWPVQSDAGAPGLLLAGVSRRLTDGDDARIAGRVRVLAGSAEIAAAGRLWSSRDAAGCEGPRGCAFDVAVAGPSLAVLRAEAAVLMDLSVERLR